MPIYEYDCPECHNSFEEIVVSSEKSVACPKCASKKVERRLSVFNSPGDRVGQAGASGGGGCGCTPSTCGCH